MKHIFMMHHTKKYHDLEQKIRDVMGDLDYEIVYTSSMADSQRFIQQTQVPSRFYAVGGDGTLNGLLQALVHTNHEVVVIPYGTGNDFCRMMTKEKDIATLIRSSLTLSAQKIDTVCVNHSYYYINSACFGLDSVIANHVHDTPDIPLIPESKSYIVSILQHVFQYAFETVTLMSEGQTLFHGKVILCTLNNGQYYGGGFPITPQAHIQDGYLNACVVDKLPKSLIPYMIMKLLARQLENHKYVHYFKLKEADIIYSGSGNFDGEEWQGDHYHFEVIPESLNMVIYE